MTLSKTCLVALVMSACPESAHAQWSEANLIEARSWLAGAGLGDVALFGGGFIDSVTTDQVDVYDALGQKWTGGGFGLPRSELGCGAAGGKIVFAGGLLSGGGNPTDRADVFDVASGTWSQTTMPFAVRLMSVASVGQRVFLCSGFLQSGALSFVQIYDTVTGQWSLYDLGPTSRTWAAGAQDERRVYFAGGGGVSTQDRLDIYDAVTDTWSVHQMPNPHAGAGATVLDGKLYVAGGGPHRVIVDVLDVEAGTWEVLRLPTPRTSVMAGSAGPFAVFAGGAYWDDDTDQFVFPDTADVWNTWTREWTTMKLSTNATNRAIACLPEHDTILIAGGYIWPNNSAVVDNVDIFRVIDPLGVTTCSPAVPNSTGQPGELRAVGAELAADNFVTLQARSLPPGRFGYFLTGDAAAFIPNPGGSQGNLCLGGKLGRFRKQLQQSSGDGTFAISVDLRALPTTRPHDVQPGETWSFQAWYRDVNPNPTSNFTDAVAITFL